MVAKGTISTAEFIEMTGISRPRLSDLVARKVIPQEARGRFPHPDAIRAYCKYMSERSAGRGESELSRARTRLADAQREAIEHKSAIARGEYLLTSYVRDRWDTAAGLIRADVLASASAIGSAIPHLSRHDIETIDNILRAALTHAADGIDSLGDIGPKDDVKE
jgi:phage terminase Nu1 subunit (DNA packaging protein)